MERAIIGEYEARKLVEPHYEGIINSFQNGFRAAMEFHSFLNSIDSKVFHELKPLTKSVLIWNYTINWAKDYFAGTKDVEYVEHSYNSIWFNFSGLIYLRFKKLDDALKPSNAVTNRMKQIIAQTDIPGFPERPTIVDAGYTTDPTFSSITDVYLVCWRSGVKRWEINLIKETGHQLYLYDNPEIASTNLENLLKLKEEFINQRKKYGSNS